MRIGKYQRRARVVGRWMRTPVVPEGGGGHEGDLVARGQCRERKRIQGQVGNDEQPIDARRQSIERVFEKAVRECGAGALRMLRLARQPFEEGE